MVIPPFATEEEKTHEPGIEIEYLTDRQSKPYEHGRLLCGVALPLLRDDSSTLAPKTQVATMLCTPLRGLFLLFR